jgi:hypothetical protein
MMTLATGRECNCGDYGLMFDIVAGDRPLFVHALHAQSGSMKGTFNVTMRTVTGGWQANQGSAQNWSFAGEGQLTEGGKLTRLALRRPLRVEAGQRVGVYLHTTVPGSYDGVGFHSGDVSPAQGDGLVIHKGTYTCSETPFKGIVPEQARFFGGSVEYKLLPAAAAAAPAGERRPPPSLPSPAPARPAWPVHSLCSPLCALACYQWILPACSPRGEGCR